MLEFSVADSGIGIPEAKLGQLFQPFLQLDRSSTRQYAGTGLGLSIVRSLARLMGGDVGVEREVGKDSRFWFRIRCEAVSETARRKTPLEPIPLELSIPLPRRIYHILVMEDNPTNRKVIETLLTKRGYSVSCVENGQQAVDAITLGEQPDLVLMDCQMPVIPGCDQSSTLW